MVMIDEMIMDLRSKLIVAEEAKDCVSIDKNMVELAPLVEEHTNEFLVKKVNQIFHRKVLDGITYKNNILYRGGGLYSVYLHLPREMEQIPRSVVAEQASKYIRYPWVLKVEP